MTVDTAGSDYDTVIAVYTADGAGGFTPVRGLRRRRPARTDRTDAAVRRDVDTSPGTTYYVQIGGYPQSFPYGNLRVAVR